MSHTTIREYLRATAGDDPTGPADTELLAHFAATRDEASFELLVWRHAGLVQRVCRAVLGDHHAAEDAAQATFLILARKSHSFSGSRSVVGWLYRVSRRVAIRLAKDRARRSASSSGLDRIPAVPRESTASVDEVETICTEVDRLPERYRVPVLLCFFEGLTHAEAARRTGWAIGTVAGRLARAKELLARRLSRKGVGLASVALALPTGGYVSSTARAAATFLQRGTVVSGVEPSVAHLAEGVLQVMSTTRLKLVAVVITGFLLVGSGWALTSSWAQQAPANTPTKPAAQPPGDIQAAVQPNKPAVAERLADVRQRAVSLNNLKVISLAIMNYHDAYGHLPQNITDKNGKPLLSWRVAILPFIEELKLYEQFKLDEPWDSENNKRLLASMPKPYRVGFEPEKATKTYYQVFAGPKTPFEPGKKFKLDATEGRFTFGVVEIGPPVEWTRPADIEWGDLKELDLPFKNLFNATFLNGDAHSLKPNLQRGDLARLVEHADRKQPPQVNDLEAKLMMSGEDIDVFAGLLNESEKTLEAIKEQLREQKKLLAELKKKQSQLEIPPWFEPQTAQISRIGLESSLKMLKAQTEAFRQILEENEKKKK